MSLTRKPAMVARGHGTGFRGVLTRRVCSNQTQKIPHLMRFRGRTTVLEITRRSLMASMMAALAFDPERLLWVSGQKVITFPAREVFYGQISGDDDGPYAVGDVIRASFGIPWGRKDEILSDPKAVHLEVLSLADKGLAILGVTPTANTRYGSTSLSTKEAFVKHFEQQNPVPTQYRRMV